MWPNRCFLHVAAQMWDNTMEYSVPSSRAVGLCVYIVDMHINVRSSIPPRSILYLAALCQLALTVPVLVSALLFPGLKASLQRLQLEYVDVVFANRPDSNTPMEG